MKIIPVKIPLPLQQALTKHVQKRNLALANIKAASINGINRVGFQKHVFFILR